MYILSSQKNQTENKIRKIETKINPLFFSDSVVCLKKKKIDNAKLFLNTKRMPQTSSRCLHEGSHRDQFQSTRKGCKYD